MSLGIAKTQLTNPALGGGGGSDLGGTVIFHAPTTAAVLTDVNVSTLGTLDWFAYISQGSFGDWVNDTPAGIHAKVRGGNIRRSFKYWGPNGTMLAANQVDSNWRLTSVIGDDSCLGALTRLNNFLNNSVGYVMVSANNALAYSNWGFAFEALSGLSLLHRLDILLMFKSGGAATNNQLLVQARLAGSDTDSGSVTLTPGNTNKTFYRIQIDFKANGPGVPLYVSANVIQNTGDTATAVGFQSAILSLA